MTGQGVRPTAEDVLALAPDDASRRAGGRLASPGPWSETGAGDSAVWGLCKGSGSRPYQTVVDLGGDTAPAYRCSCPSRKFPCKHALGLLLLWTGGRDAPAGASTIPEGAAPPGWAQEWLSGRREGEAREAQRPEGVAEATEKGRDPEAARRRAERRRGRIAAGATDLEERLADLLRGGLAGAEREGYAPWEEMAARMVDAQAPGLASRVRELGAIPAAGGAGGAGTGAGAGDGWPGRLLAECALLHLLDQGFLGLPELPDPLAATVRARVGLTVDSAELLADASARVRDEWLVVARRDSEEGRLTARRTWLLGVRTERPALLLSFSATGPPGPALPVGSVCDAELAFHPGAQPLRAVLGEEFAAPSAGFVPGGGTVTDALAAYGRALCHDPWLEGWPAVLQAAVPVPDADGTGFWQIADAEGGSALPVAPGTAPAALWKLTALSGGAPVTVFGECGHRGFAPYTAWSDGEAVAL